MIPVCLFSCAKNSILNLASNSKRLLFINSHNFNSNLFLVYCHHLSLTTRHAITIHNSRYIAHQSNSKTSFVSDGTSSTSTDGNIDNNFQGLENYFQGIDANDRVSVLSLPAV
jgi:hypothetical protein